MFLKCKNKRLHPGRVDFAIGPRLRPKGRRGTTLAAARELTGHLEFAAGSVYRQRFAQADACTARAPRRTATSLVPESRSPDDNEHAAPARALVVSVRLCAAA